MSRSRSSVRTLVGLAAYPLVGPEELLDLKNALAQHGRSAADVRWVGARDGSLAMDWDTFAATLAERRAFAPSYDSSNDISSLVVVGDNWWIESESYGDDGHFLWQYRTIPVRQSGAEAFRFRQHHEDYFGLIAASKRPPAAPGHSPVPCLCGETAVVAMVLPNGDARLPSDGGGSCVACGRSGDARAAHTHWWSGDSYFPLAEAIAAGYTTAELAAERAAEHGPMDA